MLTNVLHVPDMNKNLANDVILGNACLKSVFEVSKHTLTKNENFVGKSYSNEGIIKLCTVENKINKIQYAYMWSLFNLCHGRLAHIGKSTIERMIKYAYLNVI